MKVKILLVPLTLVLSVTILIWFAYPMFGLVLASKKGVADEKAKIIDLEDKAQKSKELLEVLNSNADKKEKVMKFIPVEQKSEEIIDNLNYLASQDGLSIFELSVAKPTSLDNPVPVSYSSVQAAPVGGTTADASAQEGGTPKEAMVSTPKATNFRVEYGVIGNYAGIKNLLDKVRSFERFNRVDLLEIEKVAATDQNPNVDNLKVNMILVFNFLEKLKSVASVSGQALSEGKFDMTIIDKIGETKKTKVLDLEVKSSGKANPFIP